MGTGDPPTVTGSSLSLHQLLQRPPQPLQSVRDRVHACGIGEANVTLTAKRFAWDDRDLRAFEEIAREVRRCVDRAGWTVLPKDALDVWEGIERSTRHRA